MNKTIYLDHSDLNLSLQGDALIIKQHGSFKQSMPIRLIARIVCRSSVELSSSLIARLSEKGISMMFFGGRFGRATAQSNTAGTQDVFRRIKQYQVYQSNELRLVWSKKIVIHKLLTQYRLLNKISIIRKDIARALFSAKKQIQQMILQIKTDKCHSLDALRGMEGAAAAAYFKALQAVFPKKYNFNGRNRRPPKDPVNALLSFGYTLIGGELEHTIAAVGLDPLLGVFHDIAYARPSLSCDLIELYRHEIENLSWRLLAEKTLRQHHFIQKEKQCLLSKEGRQLYFPAYEQLARTLRPRMRKLLYIIVKSI